MSTRDVERVAAAVLYEGYLLYPYRPSALKNRQRFNFGVVGPTGVDPSIMQTEVLILGTADTALDVTVRCLQLAPGTPLQSVMEREVRLEKCALCEPDVAADFSWPPIEGGVTVSATRCAEGVYKVCVRVVNRTCKPAGDRELELLHSLVSTHTLLRAISGEFVSLIDPPELLRGQASECQNVGTWPVLAGELNSRATMLSSPVVLYDYPEIAAESAGELFDSTEIDEILSLRVLTLTEEEQEEIRHADACARRLLERVQSFTAEDYAKMHGTFRGLDAQG